MGSFSIWHWLIVMIIVLAIFGTRKLRNAGGDLGAGIRNFKQAMKEGEDSSQDAQQLSAPSRDIGTKT